MLPKVGVVEAYVAMAYVVMADVVMAYLVMPQSRMQRQKLVTGQLQEQKLQEPRELEEVQGLLPERKERPRAGKATEPAAGIYLNA